VVTGGVCCRGLGIGTVIVVEPQVESKVETPGCNALGPLHCGDGLVYYLAVIWHGLPQCIAEPLSPAQVAL
jgi:hypothetical protein